MIYFVLYLYEAIVCYFYDNRRYNQKKTIEVSHYKLRISIRKGLISLAIIVPPWLVMGLRYYIGTDYISYERMFKYFVTYKRNRYHTELGYYYLNRLAGLITKNPQIIFFLVAFLIVFFLFKGIEKNEGSMYYGMLGCMGLAYYFYAMNIQRQYIAIMVMLYAFYFLEQKELKKYIFFVIVAMSFHMSAIIWIPVYFMINYIPTKAFYVGTLVGAILINRFSTIVLNLLVNIGFYSGQIMNNRRFFRENFQWTKVLIFGVILLCRILFREQTSEKMEKIDLQYKPVWLAFLIYCFLYIYGSAGARIAMYLSPICLLIIPEIIECFDTRAKKWLRVLATLVLMVSMYIMIASEGNAIHSYLPYRYRMLWG